ncbi:FH2 domain-containing protein 1-like isoform X2 [Dunckerocampus dactyliophorus]|uniref:FH2 domain containing 3 isoform X2 n=1 Tax=Dunckerocampus dactyliophorus TaxID=161453 RepID=UPI0024063F05|nr:FH2 domain containing 3 isoform X2 [Dunckerocampus dactyliophorus]XP_054646886.1 FH2 domain-containing protein 1-like isoform X2 [Dunckerocampus dactyliophorus]
MEAAVISSQESFREDSHLNASLSAPLPPPPPPPPPPCLLPPPAFSCSVQRRSMKKLNWDTIPSQRVLGKLNVWTSKLPQRDLVLDIRSMEELFSHVDKRSSRALQSKVTGLKKNEGIEVCPPEHQVTILHSKKSMNIGIFLRHFKRPVAEMVQDIRQGNWRRFGSGKLKELCKLLPEESEVKQLLSFSGNLSFLPEADQFMVQLVKVPRYEELLKMMVLREEFLPLMEEVKNSLAVMIKAANELLDCDDLHTVIRLVLKAGNYMNSGGYSANAIGFRMTSLLNLADTKANKPGMNLMHYVAKQAEDIDVELLTFPSQMEHIGKASRICKDEVVADFERELKKIKEVKLYTSRHPDLFQQMETFFVAEAQLSDVEFFLHDLNVLSCAVAEYFCEDPSSFKLEECCSIFHSFCRRFATAVQENREREAAEQRCRRKESIRMAPRRRSTVLGPGLETSLESALHSLLSTAPEGVSRCRKTPQSSIQESPVIHPSGNKPEPTSQESPEKKQAKLLEEDTEKLFEMSTEGQNDDKSASSHVERALDSPATPCTPRPRTRDFFFANNGDAGSPWTILSPLTCSQRHAPQRKRHIQQHRPSMSDEDDLDDGVWESRGNPASSSMGGGPASLLEGPRERAVSKGPFMRSASMDETRPSPAPAFRLGNLFQRNVGQRSYSSDSRTERTMVSQAKASLDTDKTGNHTDGLPNNFGIISFFRRFGGRSKAGDVEEIILKGSNT